MKIFPGGVRGEPASPETIMYDGLTSFRALLFFVIFLFHILVFPAGYLAVQGFFVLSGFLLTKILVDMKTSNPDRGYFINFYGRRSLRIFPIYFFYLILVLVLITVCYDSESISGLKAAKRFLKQDIWAFTYIYNFFHASQWYQHTHLLSHFWSLAVEEQIYLVWPMVIYFTPEKHLKRVLLLIMAAGPVLRFITAMIVDHKLIPGIGSNKALVIYVSPFSYLDAFAAGGFFALYRKGGSTSSVFGLLFVLIFVGMLSSWLYDGKPDWLAFGYADFMNGAYQYIWAYTLLNIFYAHTLCSIRDGNVLPRLMEARWLVYCGTISYSLYVFHNGLIWLTITYMPEYHGAVRALVAFVCTLIIASLTFRYVEKPFTDLKDRFFRKARKNNPATAPETG